MKLGQVVSFGEKNRLGRRNINGSVEVVYENSVKSPSHRMDRKRRFCRVFSCEFALIFRKRCRNQAGDAILSTAVEPTSSCLRMLRTSRPRIPWHGFSTAATSVLSICGRHQAQAQGAFAG